MSNSISDLKLEQWLLGELSEKEARKIEALIIQDEQLRSRIDTMKSQNQVFFQEHPTATFEADVKRAIHLQNTQAMNKKNKRQGYLRIWGGTLAFCTALLVFLPSVTQPPKDPVPSKEEYTYRQKGEVIHLIAHRVKAQEQIQLFDGNAIQNGDQIQLSIQNAKGNSFVIFSLDGRGVISLHYPIENNGGLEESNSFSLPTSYRLDDAPKFENFYLVASKKVLEKKTILEKARRALEGSDFQQDFQAQLPSTYTVNRISLRKEGN